MPPPSKEYDPLRPNAVPTDRPTASTSNAVPRNAIESLPPDLPQDPTQSLRPEAPYRSSHPLDWVITNERQDQMLAQWALQTTPDTAQAQADAPTDDARAKPAPFRLLRRIGSGGYGDVYEAVQTSLGRMIAVKTMRDDVLAGAIDDPQEAARLRILFRREALTTASLEHPNIVPVYDAGTDERGQPLLAMKRVQGTPWDALLDTEREMPPGEFLARHLPVLIQVGQAVAFAHARGIVHRDLKPSQVMVGEFGEVLLMDWGLAIQVEGTPSALEEGIPPLPPGFAPTRMTASNPSGTPCYMAPEQTLGTAVQIGPWTDVYLLGGILYALLTLTPPHDPRDATRAYIEAMEGIVTPPRERAPGRDIPPELEQLAMRALAPRAEDRIHSAKAFVTGLRDYLSGAGRRAESEELTRRASAIFDQEERSYADLSRVSHLLDQATVCWPGNPLVGSLRRRATRDMARLALRNGDLTLARLQVDNMEEGPARDEIVTRLNEEERLMQRYKTQRRTLAIALAGIVVVLCAGGVRYVTDQRHARAEIERANGLLETQRDGAWQVMDFMLYDLREDLERIGRIEILEKTARQAVTYFEMQARADPSPATRRQHGLALRNLGMVLAQRGANEEARAAYAASFDVARALAEAEPEATIWRADLADRHDRLGQLAVRSGEIELAGEHFRTALALRQEIVAQSATDLQTRHLVAVSLTTMGGWYTTTGQLEQSLEAYSQAATLSARLLKARPDDATAIRNHSISLEGIARARERLGDLEGAREAWTQALELRIGMRDAEGSGAHARALVADAEEGLAGIAMSVGDLATAERLLNQAEPVRRDAAEHDLLNLGWQRSWDAVRRMRAQLLSMQGHRPDALATMGGVLEKVRERNADDTDPNVQWEVAGLRNEYAVLQWRDDQLADAIDSWGEAITIAEPLAASQPGNLSWQTNIATYFANRAGARARLGEGGRALEDARRARKRLEEYLATRPEASEAMHTARAWAAAAEALAYESLQRAGAAEQSWREALEAARTWPPERQFNWDRFIEAMALARLGKPDEARPILELLQQRRFDDSLFREVCRELGVAASN